MLVLTSSMNVAAEAMRLAFRLAGQQDTWGGAEALCPNGSGL